MQLVSAQDDCDPQATLFQTGQSTFQSPLRKHVSMTGLISKRPIIGFATSFLFGALGMLLIQIDPSPGPSKDMLWLFGVVGYFTLFVALGSLVNAVYAVWAHKSKKDVK
jgi:hypothetical protein